jgi:excinuclease UvrABC helicase subunit UvrB
MYVDLTTRYYDQKVIKKINQLRFNGVDMTELFKTAIMTADIEKLLEKQRAKELACV